MYWKHEELDFGYNQIRGRVPTTLKFKFEVTVYLMSSLFEGPIPPRSSNIVFISMSNNLFSIPIPFDIGHIYQDLNGQDISKTILMEPFPCPLLKSPTC